MTRSQVPSLKFLVGLVMVLAFPLLARSQWVVNGSDIHYSDGKVGIGTTSPNKALHLQGSGGDYGMRITQTGTGPAQAALVFTDTPVRSWGFGTLSSEEGGKFVVRDFTAGAHRLIIDPNGNLGVGTTSPQARLHVDGDVTANHFNGILNATYQDIAEWVPTSRAISPGMVVILDPESTNSVIPSTEAYDTRVAGVVSDNPGIILGEAGSQKAKIATTGRVKVKVDASRGSIRVGDLLVTSAVAGTAMKSEPIELVGRKIHQPGTLLGKALEPLASGQAEILVLLSLQ